MFVELGWEQEGNVLEGGLVATYSTERGSWPVFVEADDEEGLLVVYSLAEEPTPPDRIPEMAQLAARVNDGLPRACLELQPETGMVRCRSWLDVDGVDLEAMDEAGFLSPLVSRVVLANLATFDLFFPAVMAVASGSATASEADEAILAGE
ncbi:MAG: hypothetical protein JWM85_427 [Acidimicrobiaceae bacterium]|nr:hypothetical protein [Acidimicrobiaceae bacterium]